MQQAQVTDKVIEGLTAGIVTTANLANWIGRSRDQVIDAYDEIEAAGLKLMRVRGIGGGAQFVGKRMRIRDNMAEASRIEEAARINAMAAREGNHVAF